jgi:hypothetical protein
MRKPLCHVEWESGRRLADGLLGRIAELLKSQDRVINDLTGIVILSGPGSFTSLRIGHTVANVLAESLLIPIVGGLGDDWLKEGLSRLSKATAGEPVWPFYGAEANVTRPKA